MGLPRNIFIEETLKLIPGRDRWRQHFFPTFLLDFWVRENIPSSVFAIVCFTPRFQQQSQNRLFGERVYQCIDQLLRCCASETSGSKQPFCATQDFGRATFFAAGVDFCRGLFGYLFRIRRRGNIKKRCVAFLQFAAGETKKKANFPIRHGRQKYFGAFSYCSTSGFLFFRHFILFTVAQNKSKGNFRYLPELVTGKQFLPFAVG